MLDGLGAAYQRIGRIDELIATRTRSQAIHEQTIDPDHHDLASALGDLSIVERAMGDHAAAVTRGWLALQLPEAVRPRVTGAREPAAQGDCEAADAATTAAYDALAGQPRRHLKALHALLADVVLLQLAAHHARANRPPTTTDARRTRPSCTARCAADALVLRHRARVRVIGRASPAFESTIAGLRGELYLRLAGAQCPVEVRARRSLSRPPAW